MSDLLAYTKGISKADFVASTKAHQAADRFIRGTYDEGDGGCAVGCALKSVAQLKKIKIDPSNHQEFENHLGIPEWLARLEDMLFENVSKDRKDKWPVEFAEAINEGADLEKVKVPFIVYLMEENLKSIRSVKYDEDNNPNVKKAIDQTEAALLQMIDAQLSGDADKISAAESAAESAARSAAESAAESAARSAAESAAESAARSAAESAAESAAWSAWSARSAARSAAESAAWSAARSAAESAAFDRLANKLLELMQNIEGAGV